MTNSNRGGEPLTLGGGPLGDLIFEWSQDRYQHRWDFPQTASCLRSIESPSSQAWPASPPLQQIHQQSFGDGRQVVFGVGMAGRGHWSASFTLVPDLKCWIVELACRCPVEPDALCSSYHLSGQWTPQPSSAVSCQLPDAQLQLEAIAPATCRLTAERLAIAPQQPLQGSATTQWAFRLRVSPH